MTRDPAGGDPHVFELSRPVLTAPADRGSLRQTVSVVGRLDCVDKVVVESGCRWRTYLVDIVPDGSRVKKGEVVARLDDSDLLEREARYRVRAVEGRAALQTAKETLARTKLNNEQRVAEAELEKTLADAE